MTDNNQVPKVSQFMKQHDEKTSSPEGQEDFSHDLYATKDAQLPKETVEDKKPPQPETKSEPKDVSQDRDGISTASFKTIKNKFAAANDAPNDTATNESDKEKYINDLPPLPSPTYGPGTILIVLLASALIIGGYFLLRQFVSTIVPFLVLTLGFVLIVILLFKMLKLTLEHFGLWRYIRIGFFFFSFIAFCSLLYWAYFQPADVRLRTSTDEQGKTLPDSDIVFVFSKPVYKKDLEQNIYFDSRDQLTFSWKDVVFKFPFSWEVKITPQEAMLANKAYSLSLANITDVFGRRLKTDEFTIDTVGSTNPDQQGNASESNLRILSLSPDDGDKNVHLDAKILVSFDAAVETSTFEYALDPSLQTETNWDENSKNVTIAPTNLLQPDTKYTFILSNNIMGQQGQKVSGPISISFTTANNLKILKTEPADKATKVSASSKIKIVFNQKLSEPDLDKYFSIKPETTGNISFAENTLTFVPKSTYAENTRYTVSLNKKITGEYGGSLVNDFSFYFTTAALENAPDEQPPQEEENKEVGKENEEDKEKDEASSENIPQSGPSVEIAPGITRQTDSEESLFDLLNQKRKNNEQAPIQSSDTLQQLAEQYCLDLAKNGYLGGNHLDSSGNDTVARLKNKGVDYTAYSESIYADASFDLDTVVASWLARDTRIASYGFDRVGICVLHQQDQTANIDRYIGILLLIQSNQ